MRKKVTSMTKAPNGETPLRVTTLLRERSMRDALSDATRARELPNFERTGVSAELLADHLASAATVPADKEFFDNRRLSEAIVLAQGRPVLLVRDGVYETAPLRKLEALIAPYRKAMSKCIPSVGRIELLDHETYQWCGTGWRIDERYIVTNRHVALVFGERVGREFRFRVNGRGKMVRSNIDFREEYRDPASAEFAVAKIVWIAPDESNAPDMAVLELTNSAPLPNPLELADTKPKVGTLIGVVGYPARDSRNDAGILREIFGDIYDVKRFAPGEVVSQPPNTWYLTHDATTLGGNSGSAVFNLATRKVIGLHFGGEFRSANYAVTAATIKAILASRSWVAVTKKELSLGEEKFSETKRTVAQLKDREGYNETFLGTAIPIPKPDKRHSVLKIGKDSQLNYCHFSVVMEKDRRLPIVTAVNIDGSKKVSLKRKDSWGFDPRIEKKYQIGHDEFYSPEPFDKGHMVRREDPGWGDTEEEARQGEDDTYVYTNAVPQMPQLNQRIWLSLEDYILDNAKVRGFRVSVFTGPILNDQYEDRRGVKIPLDFWKIAVLIDDDTGKASAAGYLLSQDGMIPTEGFRYGPFRTYQVPIRTIAERAGINFGPIAKIDSFGPDITEALSPERRFVEINSPADLILGSYGGKPRTESRRKAKMK